MKVFYINHRLNIVSNCEHGDYIKVSVMLKKTMREIDTYCGIRKPPTLMSSENELEVNYVRRSSTNKPGVAFTANYSFVTGDSNARHSILFYLFIFLESIFDVLSLKEE